MNGTIDFFVVKDGETRNLSLNFFDSLKDLHDKIFEDDLRKRRTIQRDGEVIEADPSVKICETEFSEGDTFVVIDELSSDQMLCEKKLEEKKVAGKVSGLSLKNFKHQTREVCEEFVMKNPSSLRFVEQKFRDVEIFTLALESDPLALEYLRLDEQTDDVCEMAIKNFKAVFDKKWDRYKDSYTKKFAKGLKNHSDNIKMIIHQNGMRISMLVNDTTPNDDRLDVILDPKNIEYVVNQTEELCLFALRRDTYAFPKIRPDNVTKNIIAYMMTKGSTNIFTRCENHGIDEKDRDSLIDFGLRYCPKSLRFDIDSLTPEQLLQAVKTDSNFYRFLPTGKITDEMVEYIIDECPEIFRYVKTNEVREKLLSQNPKLLRHARDIYEHDIPILGKYPHICQCIEMDNYPEISQKLIKSYPNAIVSVASQCFKLNDECESILLDKIKSEI